jgi:hypothetical protein
MFCHGRPMQVNLSNLLAAQSLRPTQAQQPRSPAAKTPASDGQAAFEPLLLAQPQQESASGARKQPQPGVRLGAQLDIKV